MMYSRRGFSTALAGRVAGPQAFARMGGRHVHEDTEVTLDCHETIRNAIAGSQLVMMDGCSHITMLEQPERYNRIVRDS